VPSEDDSPGLRRKIEEALYYLQLLYTDISAPRFTVLKDQDWATAWRKDYRPFQIGERIWIHPSWLPDIGYHPEDIVILMDPGMAFGTGLHPSTRMCVQALEEVIISGSSLLDIGTGSGILAIAGAKLGARRVIAFDTDRLAVEAAINNAKENKVNETVSVFQGSVPTNTQDNWDVIVVNILAPTIQALLLDQQLLTYLSDDGHIILSGIIEDQLDDVQSSLDIVGGEVTEKLITRDWVCLVGKKKHRYQGNDH
jgi:ribosomal protein L11 methyltransferase